MIVRTFHLNEGVHGYKLAMNEYQKCSGCFCARMREVCVCVCECMFMDVDYTGPFLSLFCCSPGFLPTAPVTSRSSIRTWTWLSCTAPASTP